MPSTEIPLGEDTSSNLKKKKKLVLNFWSLWGPPFYKGRGEGIEAVFACDYDPLNPPGKSLKSITKRQVTVLEILSHLKNEMLAIFQHEKC